MKFGLLTAILEGTTFEEAVDFAAENQLECLEVACWPNTGGAKRRYAGVCHIDAEALTEEKAKEIIQYCKERNVEISSLGYYPNTLDPDLEKRKQYIDHIYALIDASSQVAGFRYILDEFGKALYTGSVDPDEYLPKLLEKLDDAGIQTVIDEMQKQVDVWKEGR